jgi:hypothetical protein
VHKALEIGRNVAISLVGWLSWDSQTCVDSVAMPQEQDRQSFDDIFCDSGIGPEDGRGEEETKRRDYPRSVPTDGLLKLSLDEILARAGSEMGRTGTSDASRKDLSMVMDDDEKPVFGAEIREEITDSGLSLPSQLAFDLYLLPITSPTSPLPLCSYLLRQGLPQASICLVW